MRETNAPLLVFHQWLWLLWSVKTSWERERERERGGALPLCTYLRESIAAVREGKRGEREQQHQTLLQWTPSWIFCRSTIDLPLHCLSPPLGRGSRTRSCQKKWWNGDEEKQLLLVVVREVWDVSAAMRKSRRVRWKFWNPSLCWCVGFNGLT